MSDSLPCVLMTGPAEEIHERDQCGALGRQRSGRVPEETRPLCFSPQGETCRRLLGLDGDLRDADQQVRVTASVLKVLFSRPAATGEMKTLVPSRIAVLPSAAAASGCAAQLEEVGAGGGDLAVDRDVAVDPGDAGVDVEVGQLDLGAAGGQRQAGTSCWIWPMTYGETVPGLKYVTLPPVIGKISEPS